MNGGQRRDISPEMEASLIAAGEKLRAQGNSWNVLHIVLGPGPEWFKRRMVPGFKEESNRKTREYGGGSSGFRVNGRWRREQETEFRKAKIYKDTRTFTQRFCGDPIFERSALFQKMRGDAA